MNTSANSSDPGESLLASRTAARCLDYPATTPSDVTSSAIDDRPSGRTKRKRTSPEDQATLEAAYARDPKPDKVERLELVKLVALGEKEVQIWYQNRRQTSRRKSRPLLPHEIAQYQLSRSDTGGRNLSFDSADCDHSNAESQHEALQETDQHDTRRDDQSPLNCASNDETNGPKRTMGCHANPVPSDLIPASDSVTDDVAKAKHIGLTQTTSNVSDLASSQGDIQSLQEWSVPRGYFANRRSAASSSAPRSSDPRKAHFAGLGTDKGTVHSSDQAVEIPKKVPARIHLSMSSEGNAIITTKDGTSPSPPRANRAIRTTVGASQGVESIGSSMTPANEWRSLQKSASGRSRDSRAWEFWCDKDSRTELEGQAEKETSGSAADAIGLLRSSSGRSILGPLTNKRNPTLFRDTSETKKQRLDLSKRPSLRRARTSFGRLQTKSTHRKQTRPSLKYSESAVSVFVPGNDSDKENWSPERSLSVQDNERSVAKKNNESSSQIVELNERKAVRLDRHDDPENDAELADFMRSGRKSVSSEDDLDCVQGLLSLSQGNWR